MSDLVSVIVPVYNVEQYLNTCINSIIHQTYLNIEIILVDDGSTDKSGELCDEFASKDSRVRAIHKSNGGLSDARNEGIQASNGKYLIFIDSDDVIDETLVGFLYNLIIGTRASIGVSDLLHCYPEHEVIYEKANKTVIFDKEDAICELLYQKSFLVSACSKIFPREYFKDICFPIGMIFEDSAVMYKLFDQADKVAYSNAKLYGYFHRKESITTNKFTIKNCDILNICKEIELYFKDRNIKLQKAADSYFIAGVLRIYLNAPNTKEFSNYVNECKSIIKFKGKTVLQDKMIRKKMKYALILYFYAPKLMRYVYHRINRWK